jgi:hypothetical protein
MPAPSIFGSTVGLHQEPHFKSPAGGLLFHLTSYKLKSRSGNQKTWCVRSCTIDYHVRSFIDLLRICQ